MAQGKIRWMAESPAIPESHAVLGRLLSLRKQREQLDAAIDETALLAKELGASWAEVGEAMGVTASAAHQRWSELGKFKHAERQARLRAGEQAGRPLNPQELDQLRVAYVEAHRAGLPKQYRDLPAAQLIEMLGGLPRPTG